MGELWRAFRWLRADADGTLTAEFDVAPFGLTPEELSLRSSIDEDLFVRVRPRAGDPGRGQTILQLLRGGITCTVLTVDWINGRMTLSPIPQQASAHVLSSWGPEANAAVFDYATVDESPSDFVASRVERRLRSGVGRHVYDWLEPEVPRIPEQPPLPPARWERVRQTVSEWEAPHGRLRANLTEDQRDAMLEGLFLGSRTTLIAAETAGRTCLAIELDPLFADVAVRRWQAFTGREATLQTTGVPFDQVEAERAQQGAAIPTQPRPEPGAAEATAERGGRNARSQAEADSPEGADRKSRQTSAQPSRTQSGARRARLPSRTRSSRPTRMGSPRGRPVFPEAADQLGSGRPRGLLRRLCALGRGDGGDSEIRDHDQVAVRVSRAVAVRRDRQPPGRNHDADRLGVRVHAGEPKQDLQPGTRGADPLRWTR
jgi:hypothetical protein